MKFSRPRKLLERLAASCSPREHSNWMAMGRRRTPFILSAVDPDLLCPWLEVRFETDDFETLCRSAELDVSNDPELENSYLLAPATVAAVCTAFGIEFEHGSREAFIYKHTGSRAILPYLVHTGFELALMVQGRKPFAFIDFNSAAPTSVRLKARFDAYVAQGILHSHEEIFDTKKRPGHRIGQVLYAVKGEEWRIPALEFIRQHINRNGDGVENLERLEGALLGYERWQNDCWIDHLAKSGVTLYGAPLICKVDRAQYDWLVHAGFRALPPFDASTFTVHSHHWLDDKAMEKAIQADPRIEAFVQFNIGLRYIMHAADFRIAGPYDIPTSLIPTINRNLVRTVRILIQRAESPGIGEPAS
ncbi:UNVERIFIED_ORG: hypothetical protein J2Y81_008062 [Paraburkholderia sediminicola]|nr:hypothetical protein [Paraburkholderia sediminicola]